MKQHNRVKRLKKRQVEFDTMLKEADVSDALFLSKSYKRPGSMNK